MKVLAVIGLVFLWIFIVLLALIALLFLLSLPKAKVRLSYDGKISIGIKYLFISKTLTDGEKKKKTEKRAGRSRGAPGRSEKTGHRRPDPAVS